MAQNYFLKLDQFEGPLDLLLYLIKVNEIDILAIDMVKLSTQYLEYLRMVKFNDLNVAGDFIAMAATMLQIKTRELLPNEAGNQSSEDGDEDDPAATLQQRLLEYEQIRGAADHLATSPQIGHDIQTANEYKRLDVLYEDVDAPLTGDPFTLVILMERMLKDLGERKPEAKVQAVTHLVTLEQKIEELKGIIANVNFVLFQGFYKDFTSRYELVVYILAVLELCKWQQLKVFQQDINGPLWVYEAGFDPQKLPVDQPYTLDADTVEIGTSEDGAVEPEQVAEPQEAQKQDEQL